MLENQVASATPEVDSFTCNGLASNFMNACCVHPTGLEVCANSLSSFSLRAGSDEKGRFLTTKRNYRLNYPATI
ncbi:hypothetical protein PSHT_14909 [Puccinia striiformis]|uniref:Uncharacterized protein n=1 Tax=Puccinia striiformis TaxID=27350 RepID=A0A2S4UHN3_9BASI|nr:hypothetical protein PSHT_14909 [Puccinia striiformis]